MDLACHASPVLMLLVPFHIIAKGIEKIRILKDSADSNNFLARIGKGPGGHT
jgi:hypothetical protein